MKYCPQVVVTYVCLFIVVCTGCEHRQDKSTNNACEITIKDYEQDTFITKSAFSRIDTLPLLSQDGIIQSQVLDLCLNQKCIYILDNNHSLSCYDRTTGNMLKYIRAVGHGTGEYIMPKSICAKADEVYLLHERACNVYDTNLNFKRKIEIGLTALDFIKIDDGFLFCNLVPSGDTKRLVYTDNKGRSIDSYLNSSCMIDVVSSTKCFFSDEDSNVYFTEPTSDELYQWRNNGIELCCRSIIENSFEGHPLTTSEKDGYAYNTKWFKLNNKIVNSFLYLGRRYYNVYDTTSQTSVYGCVNSEESIPFAPRWQWVDGLYGIYSTYDEDIEQERLILSIFCL